MPLYDYLTPKLDFKRKFNHRQSFLYKGRLTVRTIRKFRIGSSLRIEFLIGSSIRNRIESRSFAGPYLFASCPCQLSWCLPIPPLTQVTTNTALNVHWQQRQQVAAQRPLQHSLQQTDCQDYFWCQSLTPRQRYTDKSCFIFYNFVLNLFHINC